jgi:hypothetical protein
VRRLKQAQDWRHPKGDVTMRRRVGHTLSIDTGKCLVLAFTACLSLLAEEAHAINRYTSTSMTCAKVQATISREGAAIMQHRSPRTGLALYDRYVKNRLFCPGGQTTDWTSIPTSDQKSCRVYRCEDIQIPDFR